MVIKASAAAEIRALVDALGADDDVQREAAIARLGVIGPRAVDQLTDAYARRNEPRRPPRHPADARSHRRSSERAARAAGARRGRRRRRCRRRRPAERSCRPRHAATAAAALDALVATALDERTTGGSGSPPSTRCRTCRRRCGHASPRRSAPTRACATSPAAIRDEAARAEAVWNDAVDGRLPDDAADAARRAGHARGAVGAAQHAARADRRRAGARSDEAMRCATRGMARAARSHCTRRSRSARQPGRALRSARELVAGAASTPLPVSFLAALHVLGDASCLEPLAVGVGRGRRDDAGRRAMAPAAGGRFRAIVQREKMTKRHAAMKRIAARWPGVAG